MDNELLSHFELFGRSRVTDPPDGAEIGCCHESHWCLPAVTYSMWQRNSKNGWTAAEIWACRKPKLVHVTRPTGICRSKISAQRSRVTSHAEQFEMVQYNLGSFCGFLAHRDISQTNLKRRQVNQKWSILESALHWWGGRCWHQITDFCHQKCCFAWHGGETLGTF